MTGFVCFIVAGFLLLLIVLLFDKLNKLSGLSFINDFRGCFGKGQHISKDLTLRIRGVFLGALMVLALLLLFAISSIGAMSFICYIHPGFVFCHICCSR